MTVSAISRTADALDSVLEPLLGEFRDYALLDFPDHMNIGDSAIYAGEIAALDRYFGRPASYVCTLQHPLSELDAVAEDTVVLLHGGGNFGDVWDRHQLYRESVIDACRHRKVIQMPQSIHYSDTAARDRTARVIAAHPDFTLLVRDRPSFELASAQFDCEVLMCPDMAFALAPVTPPDVPIAHETMCLLRDDHERVAGAGEGYAEIGTIVDWPTDMERASRIRQRVLRVGERLPLGRMRLREWVFRTRAAAQTNRGFRLLAGAERIVTDRLHGHILSTLLGKPHVVLDNFYGKIGNFISAWPEDPNTRRATDIASVRAALEDLSAR